MLKFTDLNLTKHFINMNNINNIVIRNNNGVNLVTFHMANQHIIPATVDIKTAERLIKELENS